MMIHRSGVLRDAMCDFLDGLDKKWNDPIRYLRSIDVIEAGMEAVRDS